MYVLRMTMQNHLQNASTDYGVRYVLCLYIRHVASLGPDIANVPFKYDYAKSSSECITEYGVRLVFGLNNRHVAKLDICACTF